MNIPAAEPYMEGHNTWCVNRPGTLLLMPVADLAQHAVAGLCFLVQNGYVLFDDVHAEPIPGLEPFRETLDLDLDLDEELPAHVLRSVHAHRGDSRARDVLLRGDADAPGHGAGRVDVRRDRPPHHPRGERRSRGARARLPLRHRRAMGGPEPHRDPGVFDGYCPPHHPEVWAAVDAFAERKFGPGGPFHPDTPGPWRESAGVRSSAQVTRRSSRGASR